MHKPYGEQKARSLLVKVADINNTVNYSKIEKRAKVLDGVRKALIYFLLSVWGIVVLFPFYWMVLTSVKSYGAYSSEHIPKLFTT